MVLAVFTAIANATGLAADIQGLADVPWPVIFVIGIVAALVLALGIVAREISK